MKFDELMNPQLKRYRLILSSLRDKGITLDLGSEKPGLHEFLLENINSKVIGVDVIPSKNTDIVHDLNNEFPFPKNYADNIVAGKIMEHVINPFYFLKECHKVLKKNGRLVLTTDNMLGFNNFVAGETNWSIKRYKLNPHLYAWNMEMLTTLIKKAGFKIKKTEYLNVFWRRNLLFRFICFCVPKIRPVLFVMAKK